MTRILVLESNTPDMVARGLSDAQPFLDTIPRIADAVELSVAAPYEAPFDPATLDGVDGVVFTGSGVVWCVDDARAAPLAAAMEAAFQAGVPVWGSCNGMQLAAHVLGGVSAASPNGHEDGVAREVTLTEAGRIHPMMQGRSPVYAAPCVHRDEVRVLPDQAVLLAGNGHSTVQAFAYEADGVDFWGTQYHPEFSAAFVAECLGGRPDCDTLKADLARADSDDEAAGRLGISVAQLQVATRATELRNWIGHVRKVRTAL